MSPRGTEGIKAAKADIEKRKSQGGGGGLWLRIDDGESIIVRFLEQGDEIAWAWVHEVQEAGRQYPNLVVCRDQEQDGTPCPGCEQGLKRRFRAWINTIWRDAPVRAKDKDGNWVKGQDGKFIITGNEDQLAVWNQGIEVFDTLVALDGHYKGLMSRDFTISRSGKGLETKYNIMPNDAEELSDTDKALAENKSDLDRHIVPQEYEQWGERPAAEEKSQSSSDGGEKAPSPFTEKRDNPFANKK